MSSFHEVLFPAAIALGATGGPELPTDVVRLSSGMESRNARWAHSRRRWDVGGAVMRMDQAQELTAFFEARGGRTYGFRFRDPLDLKSCVSSQAISALDQPLGIGDGERVDFQLVKGGGVWSERIVSKPVAGSVVVAADGAAATGFEVDTATGVVTFDAPPAAGAVLTAGFAFDVPVRFDTDRLDVTWDLDRLGSIASIPLVEVRR